MADLGAIRNAMKAKLEDVLDWQVVTYPISDPTPPTIYCHTSDSFATYDLAGHRASDRFEFKWVALAKGYDDQASHELLDSLVAGPRSIKAALQRRGDGEIGQVTLGGLASDLRVEKASEYFIFVQVDGQRRYLACEFTVCVFASGGDE